MFIIILKSIPSDVVALSIDFVYTLYNMCYDTNHIYKYVHIVRIKQNL